MTEHATSSTSAQDELVSVLLQLEKAVGNIDTMIRLAARIGQSSMTIDPMASLDRKELREWRDGVWAAQAQARELLKAQVN